MRKDMQRMQKAIAQIKNPSFPPVSENESDPPKRYAQNKVAKKPAYRIGQKISKGDTTSFELRPKGVNEEGFMEFNEVIIPNEEYKRRMGK
jgi:hypothetical protein